VAVEAAVFGAHLAGLLQPLAQLPPRAVQADLQIASRDPDFLGDGFRRPAIEVGELEHLRIFGPEGRQQFAKAAAGGLLDIGFNFRTDRQFLPESLQAPSLHRAPPMQVGEHIAENSVEPREQVLVVGERMFAFERAQQALLHGIGGELIVAESSSGEALESAKVGEQGRRERIVEFGFGSGHE